ncbi:hypothetical protein [Streptomyces sp. V1I1]|uniref:hypothetical protein n=1 Tax=Streptomyces sp. V1I1 TaxID=3042272 RepID=UPI0027D8371D|nr:hypothetical protein [Streptomyces sp. V1I1]
MARNLKWIEQAKKDTGGKINHALDMVAVLILETGDPDGVYNEVLQLLHQVRAERATATTPATAA